MRRGVKLAACLLVVGLMMVPTSGMSAKAADGEVSIDKEHFPSSDFRKFVKQYDEDNNGILSEDEIADVTEMVIEQYTTQNVKGISYFTSLKELKCSNSMIVYVDLTECNALETVEFEYCMIEKVDAHGLESLKELYSDPESVEKYDLRDCSQLTELVVGDSSRDNDGFMGSTNSLKLTGCENLESLSMSFLPIKEFDFSQFPALKYLEIHNCLLKELDLSKCPELECVWADRMAFGPYDAPSPKSQKVVSQSYAAYSNINLSGCTKLKLLDVRCNQLTTLDLSEATELEVLKCSLNKLTSLDLSQCYNLSPDGFECYGNANKVDFKFSGIEIDGLDVTRIINLEGATISGKKLIPDKDATVITYSYFTDNFAVDAGNIPTFTIKQKSHIHEYGEEWKSDGKNHWHECLCGAKGNVQAHENVEQVEAATLTANGKVENVCEICGHKAKKETIYRPKTMEFDTNQFEYTGEVFNPTLIVKDSKKNKIDKKYYSVQKADGRKKVGKYTYKITFKDRYEGTKSVSFKIVPKKIVIKTLAPVSKGFKITWNKHVKQTTGYTIRYSEKSNMKSSKYVDIKKNTTTSKTIKKLEPNKEYYVQLRTFKEVNGKKYNSEWSKPKNVRTK